MLLEPSIDRSEGLRMLDFIQRAERREETAECGVVLCMLQLACCNRGSDVFLPLQLLVDVQGSADSGAEAQRPMHNSEFDQEQVNLDAANLRAILP